MKKFIMHVNTQIKKEQNAKNAKMDMKWGMMGIVLIQQDA